MQISRRTSKGITGNSNSNNNNIISKRVHLVVAVVGIVTRPMFDRLAAR